VSAANSASAGAGGSGTAETDAQAHERSTAALQLLQKIRKKSKRPPTDTQ
jgi:hypothetical protein